MSWWGHALERRFYIDQIVVKAPHYKPPKIRRALPVGAGLNTAMPRNVEEMIDRLKFDILYVEKYEPFA